MSTVTVNGAEFYYELHGKGQPIVLISGYSSSHLGWLPIAEKLSQYAQVLVFDNRGVGQTSDNGQPLSAELMAQDVVAIAKELDLKRPHIVGSSMGGTIAQCVASLYPEEISKLCLVVSSSKWREAPLVAFNTLLKMREFNVEFNLIFENLIAWLLGQNYLMDKEAVATLKKNIIDDPYPQSLSDQARQFQVLMKFNGQARLKNIKAPTLVINGKEDLISLSEESEYLAKHIPNATLNTFSCGHMVALEKGDLLIQSLVEFFNLG